MGMADSLLAGSKVYSLVHNEVLVHMGCILELGMELDKAVDMVHILEDKVVDMAHILAGKAVDMDHILEGISIRMGHRSNQTNGNSYLS